MAPRILHDTSPRPLDHPANSPSILSSTAAAVAGAPGVADRGAADGQAQADFRPVNGLRRLRGRHQLRGAAHHGQEALAEDVLPAQHAAR